MLEAIMKRTIVKVHKEAISEALIDQVWHKGRIINGHCPGSYREDICGALMIREMYGQTNSKYGWVVDLIDDSIPDIDSIDNLRPLQWENKKGKVNGEVVCIVTETKLKKE